MNRFVHGLIEGELYGLDVALRSALVLGMAWLLATLLKRRAAASRHLVWSAALIGVLVLPLAQPLVPGWRVLPPERKAVEVTSSSPLAFAFEDHHDHQTSVEELLNAQPLRLAAKSPSVELEFAALAVNQADIRSEKASVVAVPATDPASSIESVVGAIWIIGVLLFCLPVVIGTVRVWQLHRSSVPVPGFVADEVRLLAADLQVFRHVKVVLSLEQEMPMTWGFFVPVLLLPAASADWSRERRRIVLLHELAHIQRWDCLTQLLGQFARALHWFNPLAWLALHRLRLEQERACDDVVLNCGTNPNDYASELLSVTARLPRSTWDTAVALAMSRCSRIEKRLQCILDAECERRPISRQKTFTTCGLMLIAAFVIAAVQRQTAEATILATSQTAVASEDQNTGGEDGRDTTTKGKLVVAEKSPLAQATANSSGDESEETSVNADGLVQHVLNKIAEVNPTPVDPKSLNDAAIRGMLHSLNDPYSSLMTTEETQRLFEQVEGKLVGIGAALANEGNEIVITALIPNSPALRGGLQPGDTIIEINGQAASKLSEAVKQIRGQAGTEVTLRIRRSDKSENVTLQRAEVRLPTVKGLSLDEQGQWRHWLNADQKIAVVQITSFDRESPGDLKETLTHLNEQGLKGLILDLRGNSGGLLDSCVEIARLFLKEGTIVQVRGRADEQNTEYEVSSSNSPLLAETPMIVLIDQTTASAAEVLAAALKDNNRATLLGERTFGKGSVQSILPLGDEGQSLKITTALIYSPNGQLLHRAVDSTTWGVDPHDGYYVPLTPEQRSMRPRIVLARETGTLQMEANVSPEFLETVAVDPQLAAALKSLSAKLSTGEFAKTGRPIADQTVLLNEREALRRQRDELRAALEQLDRQLEESR